MSIPRPRNTRVFRAPLHLVHKYANLAPASLTFCQFVNPELIVCSLKRSSIAERRHCILWIRPYMAKYFQAEMKTVYLLGRDKPSVLVCLYIMNYKEESIVSSNIVYANENKIMRRNTKKMSRFIAYIIVNPYICSGDT